jgi:8-oxo-dGTP pyrophosphatase MutT (NUDIX family)
MACVESAWLASHVSAAQDHVEEFGMSNPPEWFYNQSAAIPFRRIDGRIEVALITSSSGKRWVIPKGVIDPGETAASTAVRETEEEAGLRGRLSEHGVGSYEYEKWGGTCHVEVFLLDVEEVMEEWDESDVRRREWISPDEAARRVREEDLKVMVRSLPALLEEHSA